MIKKNKHTIYSIDTDKDTASLIIKFRDDFGKEDIFILENFSCAVEFYGWEKKEGELFISAFVEKAYHQGRIDIDSFFGDIEYAKKMTRSKIQYVLLDSTSPFYNSIWGQIPADVAKSRLASQLICNHNNTSHKHTAFIRKTFNEADNDD